MYTRSSHTWVLGWISATCLSALARHSQCNPHHHHHHHHHTHHHRAHYHSPTMMRKGGVRSARLDLLGTLVPRCDTCRCGCKSGFEIHHRRAGKLDSKYTAEESYPPIRIAAAAQVLLLF
ncbi:hypothetical protein EV426DRAFT_610950, partial [Tirmania nivea]